MLVEQKAGDAGGQSAGVGEERADVLRRAGAARRRPRRATAGYPQALDSSQTEESSTISGMLLTH